VTRCCCKNSGEDDQGIGERSGAGDFGRLAAGGEMKGIGTLRMLGQVVGEDCFTETD
jgi:hypothetical protein